MGYGGLKISIPEFPPGSFVWPPVVLGDTTSNYCNPQVELVAKRGGQEQTSDTTPRERISVERATKKSDCLTEALQVLKNSEQLRDYANTFPAMSEERLKYLKAAREAAEEAWKIASDGGCDMELVAYLQKIGWVKSGFMKGVCAEHGLG